MKNHLYRLSSVVIATIILSACVNIRTPQITAITQLITPQKVEVNPFLWRLTFGEYVQSIMYIRTERGQGFANEYNDILTFDDRIIRRIAQINDIKKDIRFIDEPLNDKMTIERKVLVNSQLYITLECEPWRDDNAQQSSQSCYHQEKVYRNILLYNDNQLIQISMTLPYLDTLLTLQKI